MQPETEISDALRLLEELRARIAVLERRLAPPPIPLPLPAGELAVLVVGLGAAEAALPLDVVEEVVPYAWLTPLPEAPTWVAGVLDLGGRAVCIVDVASRMCGTQHAPRLGSFIILCRLGERSVGLVVDALGGTRTFPSSAVAAPPPDVPSAAYLMGVVSHTGAPLILLSIERLFYAVELPGGVP